MVDKDAAAGDEQVPASEPRVEPGAGDAEESHEVMKLLGEHVPLALLADLAIPTGPESPRILEDEGLPEVAWWEGKDDDDPAGSAASAEDETVTG